MRTTTAKRLRDAVDAIEELEQFTAGHTRESFMDERGLQLIVQELLEIVGEALNAAGRIERVSFSMTPLVLQIACYSGVLLI